MNHLARRAPAVRYAFGRSTVLGMLLGGFLLASAAGLVVWTVQGANSSKNWVFIAACLWLTAAWGAFHFWSRQCAGILGWDGQAWTIEIVVPTVETLVLSAPPHVFIDLHSHLWVSADPMAGIDIWIWLQRSRQPERWMDLRRAVYSRAISGADNPDEIASASSRGA
jgi:hypothetical protein